MIGWTPEHRKELRIIDIRIKSDPPWNRLAPEYQHGQIPIPGISGMYAESVTGVMEGLKLVGPRGQPGKINTGYFAGPGRLRAIKKDEWLLGYNLEGRRIDLGEARRKILIPSYHWILWNRCHDLVANLRIMGQDQDLWIFDGISNQDLDEFQADLSVAFVLVSFLKQDLSIAKPLVLQ
jgi:hypothetical protein